MRNRVAVNHCNDVTEREREREGREREGERGRERERERERERRTDLKFDSNDMIR